MTDIRLNLAVRFANDVRSLSALDRLPAAQVLLATAELALDSNAIRARVDGLLGEGPLYQDDDGELLFAIVRQLVFTRYGVQEGSRREFLSYWIEDRRYRDRETIGKSFLMNLANENLDLLSQQARTSVARWFLRHPRYKASRATAWAVHHLAHLGHRDEARRIAEELLAEREENGSWGDDLRWTTSVAFPLVRSEVVTPEELAVSLDYVLKRAHRGFLDDILVRAALVKLLHRMNELSGDHLRLIRSRTIHPSSIFLSHSTHDNAFVRRLANDLAVRGIRVWVDDAEIRAGKNLFDHIESALYEMDFLGVVLSERSVTSEWVSHEITMRLMRDLADYGAGVIPLLLDHCHVRPVLRSLPSIDFRAGYDEALQRLVMMLTQR